VRRGEAIKKATCLREVAFFFGGRPPLQAVRPSG